MVGTYGNTKFAGNSGRDAFAFGGVEFVDTNWSEQDRGRDTMSEEVGYDGTMRIMPPTMDRDKAGEPTAQISGIGINQCAWNDAPIVERLPMSGRPISIRKGKAVEVLKYLLARSVQPSPAFELA